MRTQRALITARHVLLVVQSTTAGGMETHCVDLAAEYARRGIHVTVLVPEATTFDHLAQRFQSSGGRVERLDTDARTGRVAQLPRWLRLMRIVRRAPMDVVHLHTGGSTGGFAVVVAARMFNRAAAVVVTEHDVPRPDTSGRDRVAKRAMDLLAHRIVAVSQRNATLRRRRVGAPEHKFAAIVNGVPAGNVSREAQLENRRTVRAQVGLSDGGVVVGSLVRLATGKGLHDLLHACAIASSAVTFELLLVGDGPLREELETLATSLGLAGRVRFAGSQVQPVPYLDAMDVFVLAVPSGSMSIALLEAMARGLPAVITFCGPEEAVIPEVTGLCSPPGESEALARVLERIVGDGELRARLGVAAARHVQRQFSVQRVADDLLELYATARRAQVPERLRAAAPPDACRGAREASA